MVVKSTWNPILYLYAEAKSLSVTPRCPMGLGRDRYLASITEARFSASILWKTCGSCTRTWLMEPVIGTFLTATCQESMRALGSKPPPPLIKCHPRLMPHDPNSTQCFMKTQRNKERAHLALKIDAVLAEHRVDLGILQGPKKQCLTIVLRPIIEAPHPHSREVHPV